METRNPGPMYEKKFFQLFFCEGHIQCQNVLAWFRSTLKSEYYKRHSLNTFRFDSFAPARITHVNIIGYCKNKLILHSHLLTTQDWLVYITKDHKNLRRNISTAPVYERRLLRLASEEHNHNQSFRDTCWNAMISIIKPKRKLLINTSIQVRTRKIETSQCERHRLTQT